MKEPKKIRLNPETPTHKDVQRLPLPPVYKPEWDIINTEDDLYSRSDLENNNIGNNDEDNNKNDPQSIQ